MKTLADIANFPAKASVVDAKRDRRVSMLAVGMFAIGTDSFVVAPMLPQLAQDLDVSLAIAAQLITVYALCYAVSSPFVVTLTAKWRRERALIIALMLFAVANVGAALAPNIGLLLLARSLAGVAAAIFAPIASATAADLAPAAQRGRALSTMMVGLSSATAVGTPLAILIGTFANWRAIFVCVAVLAAGVIFAVARRRFGTAPGAGQTLPERLRPLRNPRVLIALLTTFLFLMGLYVNYTYIAAIFGRATADDGKVVAILQSIWGFAGIAGALMAGRLNDRLGHRMAVNLFLAVAIVNFSVLPLTSATIGGATLSIFIWGVCAWGFVVPQQHRLIAIVPEAAPIVLSLYAMAVYGGASAAAVIGAIALRYMPPHELPLVGAGLIFSGILVDELTRRRLAALPA